MRYRSLHFFTYHAFGVLQWSAGIAATIFSACLKADPHAPQWPAVLSKSLATLQANTWWMVPTAIITGGVATLSRRMLGAPWVWDHVRFLLDRIRDAAFPQHEYSGGQHHHRVTLFKHCGFCCVLRCAWPWSGWLKAVARSGHSTQNRRIVFMAPDDADAAEGVVGIAWSNKRVVLVENLPDLTVPGIAQKTVAEYAEATKMRVDRLMKRLPGARSIYAIPVESRNRVWGVLVFDSREPTITRQVEIDTCFTFIGKYLGKLLEKT
jgi:hypothetical protein